MGCYVRVFSFVSFIFTFDGVYIIKITQNTYQVQYLKGYKDKEDKV